MSAPGYYNYYYCYYYYFIILFFGDQNCFMATILQLKVAKRRPFEKVSLERCKELTVLHAKRVGPASLTIRTVCLDRKVSVRTVKRS